MGVFDNVAKNSSTGCDFATIGRVDAPKVIRRQPTGGDSVDARKISVEQSKAGRQCDGKHALLRLQ